MTDQPADLPGGDALQDTRPAGAEETGPVRVRNPRVESMVTGAAYGALIVFGLGVGLYESFSYSWSAGSFPLAAVLISVLNFGIFWGTGWGMGGKLGAVIPASCWLLVVMVFSIRTPSGGLVVTGSTAGNVFLLAGTLAGVLAITFTRSSGNWLLRGGPRQTG
jgi:hypothetical protein